MCGFYGIVLIAGKTYTNFFSPSIKRMTRQYISTLKSDMTKENLSLDFRHEMIDETRDYLLKEIKLSELTSKNLKKKYTGL